MGNVYVATDERFKSVVAIKETIFEDASLRKAFEREARLLNSLKHSALPRVSDHFDEENGQFLVMEFIAGDDLAAMMEKNGAAFPLETVLGWARQLCDALEYLHAQEIIHRDIKPQNLKLTPSNHIVLLDFGLAKGNAIDSAHQTAAKSIFGFSRNYASLEQIQGAGTEPRSDLYSLSATLYHLLTGVPPADALTRAMNVLNKQSDPLIPANLVNRKVPRGVAEVLQKTMALNADERPKSAASMRQMLNESDQTIDLSATDSAAADLLTADFLTQETKIIGAKTNVNADADAKADPRIEARNLNSGDAYKTNGDDSESTMLRPLAAPRSGRSKTAVSALALGSLLLIGLLYAGYFSKINDSQTPAVTENPNAPNSKSFSADSAENITVPNSNVSGADTMLAEQESANASQIKTPPAEITKDSLNPSKKPVQNSTATKSAERNDEPEKIVINGETVEIGDLVIDENGIRSKKSGNTSLPSSPELNLTPEQIRKFERLNDDLEKRRKRVVVVKPPTPPSVPDPTATP